MKKFIGLMMLGMSFMVFHVAYAAHWTRGGNVTEKEWTEGKPKVFGVLSTPPPNNDNCSGDDRALIFNISVLAKLAGNPFDVNKIYVDGVGWGGDYALNRWLNDWNENGHGYSLPALVVGNNWSGINTISVCVGTEVSFQTFDWQLKAIVFWYDGPVETTIFNTKPKPDIPPYTESDHKNMANTDDSLKVSNNGITLRDTHETPPSGSTPPSISGSRVDLRPDFDIYDTAGKELSANCDNCMGKSVDPGQAIRPKLWTQVGNANTSNYKRNSDSDTIEGPVWWMIEGKTGWNLLASGEYTISKLTKGAQISETHNWNVPNYPGDILAMKACVDGDDEIWEEGESSTKKKITSPDQSGTSNNCSRRERFYIEHPNYIPTGAIESGDCVKVRGWAKDQNIAGAIMIHAYISPPDGTNEQYLETFMADKPRGDLGGNYGIDWSVSESVKVSTPKKLTFRAVNTPEGTNPVIGSLVLTCSSDALPESDEDAVIQIFNAL